MKILFTLFLFLSTHLFSFAADEATLVTHSETFERAHVVTVQKESLELVPGTETKKLSQSLLIHIDSGELTGKEVTVRNDLTTLSSGDKLYIRHTIDPLSSTEYFDVAEPERTSTLYITLLIFITILAFFGGAQGMRGLLSLCLSILAIFYLLIPGIAHGYNPILIATLVSSVIIILGSYITHGYNKTTTSAVCGMIATVVVTGIYAYYTIVFGKITGYSEEASSYLLLNYKGSLDMAALLFGGIMIGLLGVLYDSAIGQAVAIEELVRASKGIMTKKELFSRGMRIGREHIGALVNTLAIAYVGVALPLLLLVRDSTTSLRFMINSELFATEILRILIGSIGLVLAVPLTTYIAVQMLYGKSFNENGMKHHGHRH